MRFNPRRPLARPLLSAASAIAIIGLAAPLQAQATSTQQVSIEAQPLADALIEVGRRYGISVFAAEDLTQGKRAPRVSGSFSAEQAISRLLRGSGLTFRRAQGGFVVSRATASAAATSAPQDRQVRVEQANGETSPSEPEQAIVVTGSRIERSVVNSPAPIDIVTAEEIEALGLTDTTEALRFVPALNRSVSLTSSGLTRLDQPTFFGLASLDLRGLGPQRTLVLVNGRRHVGGVALEATVDVASIPTALIDRVEVLTGGGSSIYGADAVSGVVNYVLKDDFEGVDVRGNFAVPTRGSGQSYSGALTMGGNFADGRGNAVLSVEYNRQTELKAKERELTRTTPFVFPNSPAVSEVLGIDPRFRNALLPDARLAIRTRGPLFTFTGDPFGFPGIVAGGTTSIGGVPVSQVVDPETGQVRPQDFGRAIAGPLQLGGDGTPILAVNPEGSSIPDSERYFINAFANYDFTDTINGFVEAKYSRNETDSISLQNSFVVGVPIQRDNPFIPALVQDQFDSLNAQGLDPNLVVTRPFLDDVALQPFENTRETFRIVGGFQGTISKSFAYEISANYGRTDTVIANNGEVLPDRLYAAADVVADPVTGEPICRSDIDQLNPPPGSPFPGLRAPGFRSFVPGDGSCVPLNVFAQINTLNPAALNFFTQRTETTFELEQIVFNATVTGSSEDYFTLPAGGIDYAVGFEYREERSERRPDQLAIAGLGDQSAFFIDQITGGSFDVTEAFAEVSVPLLADLPFAQALTLDASVRVADYSTIGNATSFAVGGVWQPVEDFRLRASFNRAIRAPNINELFTPQEIAAGALSFGGDPCDPNSIDEGSASRRANCELLVPDLATFDPTPSYAFASVPLLTGGNPNLSEETADTFTIGVAFTPSLLPGLSFVADYYDITIEGAIAPPLFEDVIVQNCADASSIDNLFCDAVTRNSQTGVVEGIEALALNVSESRARGIDYQLAYSFDLDDLLNTNTGRFTAQVAGNYLIEREDILAAGFPETNNVLKGELGFPEHFVNFTLGWRLGSWEADYGFTYQSSQTFFSPFAPQGIEQIEADPFFLDQPNSGDSFVHFIGGAYTVNDTVRLSVRVNNLFDRDPFELRALNDSFRPVSLLGRTVQFGVQANF